MKILSSGPRPVFLNFLLFWEVKCLTASHKNLFMDYGTRQKSWVTPCFTLNPPHRLYSKTISSTHKLLIFLIEGYSIIEDYTLVPSYTTCLLLKYILSKVSISFKKLNNDEKFIGTTLYTIIILSKIHWLNEH